MERTGNDASATQLTPERRLGGRKDVRIRIVFDDQVNMNMAATLNLSSGGLLMSAGVQLEAGTPISIFPLDDELDARLFELRGQVVRTFENIMESAYSDERFQMAIRLDVDAVQREALETYIEARVN